MPRHFITMPRNFVSNLSACFFVCFAAATLSGCSGKSFTDILANPTAQEAAVLNAPPLVIPPDFLERPLRKPPAWKTETKKSAQRGRQRQGTQEREQSSAVPRSLTKLPAPNTNSPNTSDTNSSTRPNQSRTAPPPPLNP